VYGLEYRVKTLSPVVITSSEGDNNMTATKDYITGGALLGVFAAKYIQKNICPYYKAHEDPRFYRWFLKGDIIFSNAYTGVHHKGSIRRLLPIPLVVQSDKTRENIYNLLHNEPDEATKPLGGCCELNKNSIFLHSPEKRLYFHHFRKDRIKGHSEERGIFYYEALSEGQEFFGTILGSQKDLEEFKNLFGDRLPAKLGRSKKAQYGNAEIELLDIKELNPHIDVNSNQVVLTFISPAVLVNQFGFPEVSVKVLSSYLTEILEINEFEIENCFARTEDVENYISVWKLKKPADKAFSCGSTFKITFKNSITDEIRDKIMKLAVCGIGERKNEGYGRVLINWPLSEKYYEEKWKQEVKKPSGAPPELVKKILTEVIKDRISRHLNKRALKNAGECKNSEKLSGNLLGRLELMLRTSQERQDFMKNLEKLRFSAKTKLQECCINRETLWEAVSNDLDWEQIFNGLRDIERIAREIDYDFRKDETLKERLYKKYWITFFRMIRKLNKKEGITDGR